MIIIKQILQYYVNIRNHKHIQSSSISVIINILQAIIFVNKHNTIYYLDYDHIDLHGDGVCENVILNINNNIHTNHYDHDHTNHKRL